MFGFSLSSACFEERHPTARAEVPSPVEPAWQLEDRTYLDSSVLDASAAYAQDPWNESMSSDGSEFSNPFFGDGGFQCTEKRSDNPRILSCPTEKSQPRTVAIERVVLHNTLESLVDTVSIFRDSTPYFRTDRDYPVAIHYVVGRDGVIVEMVPIDRVAEHAGANNADSIGIEIVANVADDPERGHHPPTTWNPRSGAATPFDAEGMTVFQYRSVLYLLDRFEKELAIGPDRVLAHRFTGGITKCPASIWPTDAGFLEWRSRDLSPDLHCLRTTETDEAFGHCL